MTSPIALFPSPFTGGNMGLDELYASFVDAFLANHTAEADRLEAEMASRFPEETRRRLEREAEEAAWVADQERLAARKAADDELKRPPACGCGNCMECCYDVRTHAEEREFWGIDE